MICVLIELEMLPLESLELDALDRFSSYPYRFVTS